MTLYFEKIIKKQFLDPNSTRIFEDGKRFKGIDETNPNKPLISIITVVKNNVNTIERTIKSVINQSFDNYEYLIIDGNSNDGTEAIIQKYSTHNKISVISENDLKISRLLDRGMKKKSITNIMKNQTDDLDIIKISDFLIYNNQNNLNKDIMRIHSNLLDD